MTDIPKPRQRFYAYVVVNTVTTPPHPVYMGWTRKEARAWIASLSEQEYPPSNFAFRVRRATVTLFEK